MGYRIALAFAVLTLAIAGAARAQPIFADFKSLCLDKAGSASAVLAAADAAGWKPVVPPYDDRLEQGLQARMKTRGDGALILQVGTAGSNDNLTRLCIMTARPSDPGFESDVSNWIGIAPAEENENFVFYSYAETAAGRRSTKDDRAGASTVGMLQKRRTLALQTDQDTTQAVLSVETP